MNISYVKINEIKPYEKNPRKIEKAVDAVMNSIKQFGFKQPIVVDADNIIVAGHARYAAAKKLGLKEVPVVVADDLTDDEVKAYRLVDNKTKEIADWDGKLLVEEMREINSFEDIDLNDFGFSVVFETEDVEEEFDADDYDEEEIYVGGSTSGEVNLDSFDDEVYEYTCPECGFKFNGGI